LLIVGGITAVVCYVVDVTMQFVVVHFGYVCRTKWFKLIQTVVKSAAVLDTGIIIAGMEMFVASLTV